MNPHQVTKDFERELCTYTGAPYAVAVNSCTMALTLAVAYHYERARWLAMEGDQLLRFLSEPLSIEIPKRTYIGVPYAIREAGCKPVFRDETWEGSYHLRGMPIWDSARYFTSGMYRSSYIERQAGGRDFNGGMVCVSFHSTKVLGDTQGGAILLDDYEAAEWLKKARFDGRTERVPPSMDDFRLRRAWHCYLSPDVATRLLWKLGNLPEHNAPLPNDNYPDLSLLEVFK